MATISKYRVYFPLIKLHNTLYSLSDFAKLHDLLPDHQRSTCTIFTPRAQPFCKTWQDHSWMLCKCGTLPFVFNTSRFSVQKTGNEFCSQFWLLIDDVRYLNSGLILSDDQSPSNTITINLILTAGQIVRVENRVSSLIYGTSGSGDINSWFTGYMLFEI